MYEALRQDSTQGWPLNPEIKGIGARRGWRDNERKGGLGKSTFHTSVVLRTNSEDSLQGRALNPEIEALGARSKEKAGGISIAVGRDRKGGLGQSTFHS